LDSPGCPVAQNSLVKSRLAVPRLKQNRLVIAHIKVGNLEDGKKTVTINHEQSMVRYGEQGVNRASSLLFRRSVEGKARCSGKPVGTDVGETGII
jgi:hypothetical protein